MAGIVIAGPAAGTTISGDPMRVTVRDLSLPRYSGDTSATDAAPTAFRSSHVVVRYDICVGSDVRHVYVPDGMPLTDAFDELFFRAFGRTRI